MRKYITISLDVELLRAAKVLAAQRNTSVSHLLANELEATVLRERDYQRSMRAALELTKNRQVPLDTTPLTREAAHERC